MAHMRVAVLGAGNRATDHLQTFNRFGDLCQLVGLCDINPDRLSQAAARYNVPTFNHLEQMLVEAKPQLVYVVVPPDGHRAAVEMVAEYGVDIVLETPIAPTLPLADAMIAAAQRHRVKLEVAENLWRFPTERLKFMIVQAGLIGRVTQVHLWYQSGSHHGMSIVRKLIAGPPARARAFVHETPVPPHVDRVGKPVTTGPYELGLVEFTNGAVCIYQYPLFHYRGNYWDIVGSDGAIIGNDLVLMNNGERIVFPIRRRVHDSTTGPVLEKVLVETDPPIVWENPWQEYPIGDTDDEVARADIFCNMRRAILERGEVHYDGANARADQEVLIAIRESALQDGAWVNLPLVKVTETETRFHEEYRRRYAHDPLGPARPMLETFFPRVSPAELARGLLYPSS